LLSTLDLLLSISAQECKLATDFSFPCRFCSRCSSEAQRSLSSYFSIFGLFDLAFFSPVFFETAPGAGPLGFAAQLLQRLRQIPW
jgi:hypothetical protein